MKISLKLLLIPLIIGSFVILSCTGSGSSQDNVGKQDDVQIEWVEPDPNEPIIRYQYSGGLLTTMVFYQTFTVNGGSGSIRLTTRIEEGTGNMDLLDEQTNSFNVGDGIDYEITVTVALSGSGSCSPTDNDLLIFDSLSAPTTREIYIAPTFDVEWNWWECVRTYSIAEVNIEQHW